MKEEATMKRRGPTWALVGLAAAGAVALAGSTALAAVTDAGDIYTNDTGLNGASFPAGGTAGMHVNPGGIGQYLIGEYYDTRYHKDSGTINNIQILNTSPNDPQSPNYNANGGSLVKVRFRESKLSREGYDFTIALSCGEVWAGRLSQNDDGVPTIHSIYPVVDATPSASGGGLGAGSFTTSALFDDSSPSWLGAGFTQFFFSGYPYGVDVPDVRHGYIEVINMESLPCEPNNAAGTANAGKVAFAGNTWSRLDTDQTPLNNISAEVFLVRAAQGISFNYNMTAIANFSNAGTGSQLGGKAITSESPTWQDCENYNAAGIKLTPEQCVNQANLALAKSRIIAQYDLEAATAGSTDLAVTLPTKYANCAVNAGPTGAEGWTGAKLVAKTPFSCANGGEAALCTIYDRMENIEVDVNIPVSPAPGAEGPCALKREVYVYSLTYGGGASDPTSPVRGDEVVNTSGLPYGESGWFEVNLAGAGGIEHRSEFFADTYDILGGYVGGFNGLPAIGLVLQEFENGNAGGIYGNAVPAIYEQDILFGGS